MSQLEKLVHDSVFTTFAALSLCPVEQSDVPYQAKQPLVWGRVKTTSPWHWSVLVCMPRLLAERVTAEMAGIKTSTQGNIELLDAVGEIANTISGRLFMQLAQANPISQELVMSLPEMGFSTGSHPGALFSFEVAGSVFGVVVDGVTS